MINRSTSQKAACEICHTLTPWKIVAYLDLFWQHSEYIKRNVVNAYLQTYFDFHKAYLEDGGTLYQSLGTLNRVITNDTLQLNINWVTRAANMFRLRCDKVTPSIINWFMFILIGNVINFDLANLHLFFNGTEIGRPRVLSTPELWMLNSLSPPNLNSPFNTERQSQPVSRVYVAQQVFLIILSHGSQAYVWLLPKNFMRSIFAILTQHSILYQLCPEGFTKDQLH